MREFTEKEKEKLKSCHADLQTIIIAAANVIDIFVLEGHRGEEEQNTAYADGKSQLKYPNGKHNGMPSMAVDIAPFPINWNDKTKFYYLAGIIKGIAHKLLEYGVISHKIRGGWDWDGDNDFSDQTFNDLGHIELTGE